MILHREYPILLLFWARHLLATTNRGCCWVCCFS